MCAAIPARWASERSPDAGGTIAPSRSIVLSIVPREEPWGDAESSATPFAPTTEEDPPAEEVQRRTAEPTTLLLLCAMLGLVGAGLAGELLFPRQPVWRPPAMVRLPVDSLKTRPSPQLVRLAASQAEGAWQTAMMELGRRGALAELSSLRSHQSVAVRALVPLAFLEMGAAAHGQIPWLAQGLASPDAAVREATITALRTLKRRHGVYHPPAGDERYRDLARSAP